MARAKRTGMVTRALRLLVGQPKSNAAGEHCRTHWQMPRYLMALGRAYAVGDRDGRSLYWRSYSLSRTWSLLLACVWPLLAYAVRWKSAARLWRKGHRTLASMQSWSRKFSDAMTASAFSKNPGDAPTAAYAWMSAGQELRRSLQLWSLWSFMSWQDIRQRYRGSILGPFWIAGGVAAVSLGAGILYAQVLKVQSKDLVPFVVIGISLWTLISLTLVEACHSFMAATSLIRNSPLPRPVHVLRAVFRNMIVFAHSLPVVAAVLWLSGVNLTVDAIWALAGFGILTINLLWLSWILALLSARFRDVIQLATYGLQFVALITPIFWFPEMAGRSFGLLMANPFYHWLEIVRAPLLGRAAGIDNWTISCVMAVIGSAVAFYSFARYRHQVAVWV
jgi:ABC-type polysaccharide/polyol phosphate export permease